MLKRYSRDVIACLWTDEAKFRRWYTVERAAIMAKVNLGFYKPDVIDRFQEDITIDADEINRIDKEIEHDLLAFLMSVTAQIEPSYQHFLHEDMTSYDTEEPALGLILKDVGALLDKDLEGLESILRRKAGQYYLIYKMALTHGQDGEPDVLVHTYCVFLDAVISARELLQNAVKRVRRVKFSGAMGNWLNISPDLETEVVSILGLETRQANGQITLRDNIANFMSVISTIGGMLEKFATDMRLHAMTACGEYREPRKPGQKGSSAMPHKRNTILLERLCGMAIALRGYAVMGQELIRTWDERDICHSSVERICLPDATILLDYMLDKMTWVVENLEVNTKRMAENIGRTLGCWASENVKSMIGKLGFANDDVYKFVQGCAFVAMDTKTPFRDVLWAAVFEPSGKPLSEMVSAGQLDECFDFASKLENAQRILIKRFGLDVSEALPSNISPEA
ncbi:MAG: lyase family protein [Patescibacteria group bacterium]